jgi:hypothetical protein
LKGAADLFRRLLGRLALTHHLTNSGCHPQHLLFAGPQPKRLSYHAQGPVGGNSGFHEVGQDQNRHGRGFRSVALSPSEASQDLHVDSSLESVCACYVEGAPSHLAEGVAGQT